MTSAGWDQAMRKLRFLAAMISLAAAPGLALAQAGTDGPLAAPDPVAGPAKGAGHKPAGPRAAKQKKIAHHDTRRARETLATDAVPSSHDLALPNSGTAPADPLSFGMKWNGNSDNARETRIQNYNATAPGSGAEVGMKLHF